MEARHILELARKWLLLIILASFIGGAAGFVVDFLKPKVYEADTTLFVSSPNHSDYNSLLGDQETAKALALFPLSNSVLLATLHIMGDRSLSQTQLASMITVDNNRDTQFVIIRVRDSNPKRAAQLATVIAEQSQAQFQAAITDSTKTKLMQDEINRLGTEIKNLEAALSAIQGSNTDPTLQADRISKLKTELSSLRQLYVELTGVAATGGGTQFVYEEMNTLENEIRDLQAALADIQGKSRTDPTLQAAHMSQLETKLSERRQLYSQLIGSYNSLTSTQVELLREAEVPKNPVGPGLRLAVAIGMLTGLVAVVGVIFFIEQTDDILHTPAKIGQVTGLPTLLAIKHLPAEATQTLLLNSYHNDTSNTVLRQPLLARGKEASDGEINSTHTPHTASLVPATRKQVPVVATGHKIRTFYQHELPDVFLTLGVFLGGQRSQLTSNGGNFRSLLITSPQDNDGKTLVASRLALSLARMGVEVVLIDANLRKPGIHTIFGLSNDVGLSTLLTFSQRLDTSSAVVQQTDEPNLAILPTGPALDLPTGVLSSSRMRTILSELSQRAFVVIDGPAVLTSSDAVILADKSDHILMVVNARHTAATKLNQSLEMLTRVNEGILGVVLNEADNF